LQASNIAKAVARFQAFAIKRGREWIRQFDVKMTLLQSTAQQKLRVETFLMIFPQAHQIVSRLKTLFYDTNFPTRMQDTYLKLGWFLLF
jgi:hypothetical protein